MFCLEGVCVELFYLVLRNVCIVDLFGRNICMYRIVFLVYVGICIIFRGYEVRFKIGGGWGGYRVGDVIGSLRTSLRY